MLNIVGKQGASVAQKCGVVGE